MVEQNEINNDTQAGLKAVDDLLTELDPAFKEKLSQMNSEIEQSGLSTALESVNIGADYLQQDQNAPKVEEIKSPIRAEEKIEEPPVKAAHTLFGFLVIGLWQTFVLIFKVIPHLLRFCFSLKKSSFTVEIKKLLPALTPLLKKWLFPFQEIAKKLRGYKTGSYIKLALIAVLVLGIKFIFSDMKKHLAPDKEKDPFLTSWATEADSVNEIPLEDGDEDIDNPQRHPEYTVLIPRIVANLKPPTPKMTPMIAAELYIEASNQDCAIEIHDRELEVRDALNQVFEESTFEELDTKDGKERLKDHIRISLNRFLTKGHVKRIFFSAFNISP